MKQKIKDEVLKIIDNNLLEFGCLKGDLNRRDLDSFQEPIASIIRLRKKIIENIPKETMDITGKSNS
jgi:hypothetical protein